MKHFSSLGFLFFLLTALTYGDGFEKVFSSNGANVWAVGNAGNVFRSSDGGITWASTPLGTTTLRSVCVTGSIVVIVGDAGVCYRSTNGGESFALETLGGGASLRAVCFANSLTGWIAGDGGTVLKTNDGGESWSSQATGTTAKINALAFVDAQTVYAAGTNGTLLKTLNGGTTWASVAGAGWTNEILSVHAAGATVYVTGTEGFTQKSGDGGANWTSLYFHTDSKVDVNDVFVRDANNAFFVGGGGFIRFTTNGGSSYTWAPHQMYAKLNDIFFFDNLRGWTCSEKNNAVMRTTDGGATWLLPQGTTITYSWQNKFSASSIGNTFMINPWNRNHLYVMMGANVWMSGNRGDNWLQTAAITPSGSTWSFYISPKDTNLWLAATSGGGKGVRRSTNRGVTWTTTLLRNFTSYGMPLEMDPDHPDTVIFAAEGTSSGPNGLLYISTDFGATWDTLSQTQFRSPCDLVIVPGNSNLWYCGDGTTGSGNGQMWRSTDYGATWTQIYSVTGSEIPMIGVSRHRNSEGFATAWGSGGVRKTSDLGVTWNSIATTSSTWGVDVAKDDPNVVMYGVYGGSTSYLSKDAGTTFTSTSLTGSNSAVLCYDRATFLVHQASSGVWKYIITYTVPTVPVPIQLASFTGRVTGGNRVLLQWTTISELNNYGFMIQRRRDISELFADLPNSFVPGSGTTSEPRHYSFVDNSAAGGSWHYRLKQIDLDGTEHFFEPIHVSVPTSVTETRIPTTFFLSQNYPNPFNPSTVIRYGLPQNSHVVLEVFDALGRSVARLIDGMEEAGIKEIAFDGSTLASGVYLYRLSAGDFVDVQRFVLMK
jgi:photosystem II stability/assembly factor-like uncharacterized protein